jgi:hypothetical protein
MGRSTEAKVLLSLVFAFFTVSRAWGQTVIITLTGTITSGLDTSGVFGAPNTQFNGQNFVLTYSFDTSNGSAVTSCGMGSGLQTNTAGDTAVLQIGSGSYTFGQLPTATSTTNVVLRCLQLNGPALQEQIMQAGDYNLAVVSASDFTTPATTWTPDSNWEDSYTGITTGNPSDGFNINVTVGGAIQQAQGYFSVSQIEVSGPVTGPAILRDGITNITGTTQPVVVGQRIMLTASLPTGAALAAGQPWSIEGTTVGGFVVSPSPDDPETGQTTKADFTQISTAFYWVAPGTYQVTLLHTINNSQSASVQATFNVAGPTSPYVSTQLGQVMLLGTTLSFGNPDTVDAGIVFTPSANLSSTSGGMFQWVQLLDNDFATITDTSGFQLVCTDVSGGELDNSYPYHLDPPLAGTVGVTSDSPEQPLPSAPYISENYTFMATMYLMWNPMLPSSIPVPLGMIKWQFEATAQEDTATKIWAASGFGTTSGFQAATSYPEWTSVYLNSTLERPRNTPCYLHGVPIRGPVR